MKEDKIMNGWTEHFRVFTTFEEEIVTTIAILKLDKTAGIDEITPDIMKFQQQVVREEVTKLFNMIVKENKILSK